MDYINYVKQSPIAGFTGYGGGATNLNFKSAAAPGVDIWTGSRGVFGGGGNGGNAIHYMTIQSTGNTSDFGDLTVSGRQGPANASNGTRGLIIGGNDPDSSKNSMDYITIGTTGNAADFGDPQVGRSNACTNGCATSGGRGVWSGGWPGNSMIEYVNIAVTGNSSDFGDLAYPGSGGFPQSDIGLNCDGTKGYFCGGYPNTTVVQYVTISTTGNSTDWTDITAARYGLAGNSSDTRATQGGGRSSNIDVIDYFTMASNAQGTDFGDLSTGFGYCGSGGDKSRGTFASGMGGAGNKIEYITIASTGNATSFGNLQSGATYMCGGVSGT